MDDSAPKLNTQQRKALWLFMGHLANELNDAGLDIRKVLKPSYNIPWTKDSVHDHLWIPIQKAMYGTDSVTQLKKHEQIDKIHKVITREIGEKFGLEYLDFPHVCPKCEHIDCLCG